ncbi:MAG: hypothetical protein JWO78_221 [Micavibrio sp.]|nr:hypothetical protein [Micavibrio sp.]
MSDNIVYASVTQGTLKRIPFAFVDPDGQPIPLNGWVPSMDFKDEWGATTTLFSCTFENNLSAGLVTAVISEANTAGLPIAKPARPVPAVYSRDIFADLKMVPPNGVILEMEEETRPKVILTVEKAITA